MRSLENLSETAKAPLIGSQGKERRTLLGAVGAGFFAQLILEMQKWPNEVGMDRAESRGEKFAQALEQLRALGRGCEGTTWELKRTRRSLRIDSF
jgi:hypothetical protein